MWRCIQVRIVAQFPAGYPHYKITCCLGKDKDCRVSTGNPYIKDAPASGFADIPNSGFLSVAQGTMQNSEHALGSRSCRLRRTNKARNVASRAGPLHFLKLSSLFLYCAVEPGVRLNSIRERLVKARPQRRTAKTRSHAFSARSSFLTIRHAIRTLNHATAGC